MAPQGFAMMLRLFIQIGYDLPPRRTAAKLLLFSSALSYYLVFEYFSCDLTARMTSDPAPLNIRSFQDVIDQDYRVAQNLGEYVLGNSNSDLNS